MSVTEYSYGSPAGIGEPELMQTLAVAVLRGNATPYELFTAGRVAANARLGRQRRVLGLSSNAMTAWAFDPDPDAPMPSGWHAPADSSDLAACARTLNMAARLGLDDVVIERMQAFVRRGVPSRRDDANVIVDG